MLKIKLQPAGKKNEISYRIVVVEARSKIKGKYLEKLGFYNPLTKPATLNIDLTQYRNWLAKGARPTSTVRKLVNKL